MEKCTICGRKLVLVQLYLDLVMEGIISRKITHKSESSKDCTCTECRMWAYNLGVWV